MSILLLILVVVVIWQGSKIAQTKIKVDAEIAGNEAYRKLAEEAVTFQSQITKDITDIRGRISTIEKLLKEIE